ncbi:uncharacterized protein LOC110601248 [Manihot esculenta]|uniref:Uncharacterized protein n=1 Tax=Manihot esculenta TaxID=3983 RepID=A0A2C9UI11_MANES|nr:uncharacterized protein LOC110601248 [Manihot esculenta]OAY29832.1 hypothetical protein MANES_15G175100v8 [Manihot esculenta]
MTVESIQETQDRVSDLGIQQKSKDFSSPVMATASGDLCRKMMGVKEFTEAEMDTESRGSSEESPKSVGKWRRNISNIRFVHNQVLRIREEDLHLGEDIGEGLSAKDKVMNAGFGQNTQLGRVASVVDMVLFSRPILPCSPLSGKTTVRFRAVP